MKKLIIALGLLVFAISSVFAGGDKNCIRHLGDIGQGSVVQNQVQVNR